MSAAGGHTPNLPVPLSVRPEVLDADGALLHFRPDPISPEAVALELASGVCLLAAVRGALRKGGYRRMPRGASIFVADGPFACPVEVPRAEWGSFMLRHGMRVSVNVRFRGGGGGGKNPLSTILSIVVIAAAVAVGGWIAGAGIFEAGGTLLGLGGATWGALASGAVMIGGMLLVNAIAPPSMPKLSQAKAASAEKIWSVDGIRNQADLYGAVPLILGRARFAPRHFAQPYTYLNGNDQYARYLLGVMGHNKVTGIRNGDTPIEQYQGMRVRVHENWQGEPFQFFPASVYQEEVGATMKYGAWHTRTTADRTVGIQWEVHFLQGCAHIDDEGGLHSSTVTMQARYRKVGTEEWIGAFGGNQQCRGGTVTAKNAPSPGFSGINYATTQASTAVFIAADGGVSASAGTRIATVTSYSYWIKRTTSGDPPKSSWVRERTWRDLSVDGNYTGRIELGGDVVYVSSGTYSHMGYSVTRATLTPVRVGYSVSVEEGQYEFQTRRITGDPNPNATTEATRNESTWATLKSLRAGPVVKYTGVPYTIIELDIKASEQLSGHLEEINAEFTSYCPTWNGEEWVSAPSNNPAALMLMAATTPVIEHPVAMDDMDLDSLRGLYEWCETHGWAYNAVETSQVYARDAVQSILSACRGSFAIKNGKFGAVWDAPDKALGYSYGPRNSWGFQASKIFPKEEAHALRYRFLNETRDFQEDEMLVYADGYNADNATNIQDAEQDGCTNPDLIYKMGRLRLADSVWRPETYTFYTDFSFLFVAKGDRIPLTHDVPMWGIRQARAFDVIHAEYELDKLNRAALVQLALDHQSRFDAGVKNGVLAPVAEFSAWLSGLDDDRLRDAIEATGIKDASLAAALVIDDHVSMEEGKNYGLIHFPSSGSASSFSVVTRPGTSNVLYFHLPIPVAAVPPPDGLIHFGEAGRETHDCVVTAIETEDNLCAKITCQDYAADQIHASMYGPIPDFDSDITIPSRWQIGRPNAPAAVAILSDEFALKRLGNGALVPRIQVNFAITERENVIVSEVRVEVREAGSGAAWVNAGTAKANTGVVYAENVREGVEYELRLIAVATTGIGSDYSPVYTNTVIGRTTPPPPPVAIFVDGSRIRWTMPDVSPIDIRGWEVWIGFDADDSFAWARRVSNEYVTEKEFDIAPWSGWARRVWVRTRDDLKLVSEPKSVVVNLGDMPVQNVIAEVLESERMWPGTVKGGAKLPGIGLVSSGGIAMWGEMSMWGDLPMWGGDFQSMVYETVVSVPPEYDGALLKIDAVMEYGALGSVEYAFVDVYPAWGDLPMWGDMRWDGIVSKGEFTTMKNSITVRSGDMVALRVTTQNTAPALIREIVIGFDVPDALPIDLADITIPAAGLRLPVPEGHFRWISVVNLSVQYIEGESDTAFTAGWVDKGIIQDGFVVAGPLVQCKDKNDNLVRGNIDATLQGAKGV